MSAVAPITTDQLNALLPDKVKKTLNQEVVDEINRVLADPDMYEAYRDNLLSYTNVMADGRFKLTDYVAAVKYVSHKLMGDTNLKAYIRTFPDRYQSFKARGVADKDIASYVTAYNKNRLVNLIMEQTLIPTHVLNQDLYQKALNVQAELMANAMSEKVRSDAANSILTHTKAPETSKLQIDLGVKDSGGVIAALRQTTMELAAQQRLLVQSGAMNAQQVAHSRITPVVEAVDVQAKEVKP